MRAHRLAFGGSGRPYNECMFTGYSRQNDQIDEDAAVNQAIFGRGNCQTQTVKSNRKHPIIM